MSECSGACGILLLRHLIQVGLLKSHWIYESDVQERFNRKLAAKRAENFQTIVEWVKNNTDKTEENDIMELALRILNKRY